MIVVGLDLSLTGAGMVWLDTETHAYAYKLSESRPGRRVPTPGGGRKGTKRDKGIFPIWDRAERITGHTSTIISGLPRRFDLAVVESPSFSSIGGFSHERSGVFWAVMTHCALIAPIAEVAPRQRAQYATGDGSSDKTSVVAATVDRYKVPFSDDNLCDALLLAAMGCRALGQPVESTLPEANLEAMRFVLWPDIERTS